MTIVLDRNLTIVLPPLAWKTATPIPGAAYTHAYYSDAAEALSTTDTRAPLGRHPAGRVFIFSRTAKAGITDGARVGGRMRLIDRNGKTVCKFFGPDVKRDPDAGYVALSVSAEATSFGLRIPGNPLRIIPIQVFPGIQTQVFLFDRNGPQSETLKMFLRRNPKFEPLDPDLHAADVAIDVLGHLRPGEKRGRVPRPIAERLLGLKFNDPMLGLLGAYLTFHLTRTLPGWVLDNLERVLPGSPDVRILRIASGKEKIAGPLVPLEEPPLLRYGTQLALDCSLEHPSLIPEGSLLDQLAPRLFVDLPWTSWAAETPGTTEPRTDLNFGDAKLVSESLTPDDERDEYWRIKGMFGDVTNTREVTWVEHALRDLGAQAHSDPLTFARRLGLPVATIQRELRNLGKGEDAGNAIEIEEEPKVLA